MRRRFLLPVLLGALGALLAACTDQTLDRPELAAPPRVEGPDDTLGEGDAGLRDAPSEAGADADKGDVAPPPPACTDTFGAAITPQFGRLDGVVRAVVVPGDAVCSADDDHVLVQVDAAGATYVLSINVESKLASSPLVKWLVRPAPLRGPAWASGWHASSVGLDYPADLGAHSSAFVSKSKLDLGALIAARIKPGTRVSAFGDGFTTGDGAHKVHRNYTDRDGALVADPTGSPVYLLFAFADQVF